ncbi:MAG: hypothetical protein HDT35_03630 [Clostridiales bacterium]|nr:hypothetical protein [Clostridiales bacterium]
MSKFVDFAGKGEHFGCHRKTSQQKGKSANFLPKFADFIGAAGGIRTHGTIAGTPDFEGKNECEIYPHHNIASLFLIEYNPQGGETYISSHLGILVVMLRQMAAGTIWAP